MSAKTMPERLHERMHALPGMPDHARAEDLNHREGPHPRLRGGHAHPHHRVFALAGRHGGPRVLVGWQEAIGRFFERWSR